MSTILITPRSMTRNRPDALGRLRNAGHELRFCQAGRQPTEDELLTLLPGCAGYLAGVEPVSGRVLDRARELRVICRNGVGVDNIDHKVAAHLGIQIKPALGANARGVTELTIGLMLSLARSLPASNAALKDGEWERYCGIELDGRTLGVIGFGRIGRGVAQMARSLGMQVLVHDLFPIKETDAAGHYKEVGLEELLASADVISLHCPPTEGEALLNASRLQLMKKGVLLINTARADLMDNDALLKALDAGQIGGVALDVFNQEPPLDRRLVEHASVIATPHIGGFTSESVDRATEACVEHLLVALGEEA